MNPSWSNFIEISYIFVFMMIAKLIKEKVGLFKSIIIPTALLAGFLGLLMSDQVLNVITYNREVFESLVYHCLGIGFIALTLAEKGVKQRRDSVNSGLFILANYCFQGVVGMLIVTGLILTIKPDLFVGLGLILPLAYGQGPGFASSIGGTWDRTLQIGYANQFGLTLATIGFLVGGLGGLVLLNVIVRRHKIEVKKLKQLQGLQYKQLTISSLQEINFFDMLTTQIVWVAVIYFLALESMYYCSGFLKTLGTIGVQVAGLIDGFNYLFGILISIGLKKILVALSKRGHRTRELVDSYLMHNIASLSFNIMITASVMAISISVIKDYWELLVAVSVGGAVTVLIFTVAFGKVAFKYDPWHYILAMFGMMTGTASTGIALLRGVDPELDTDVANNLVLGSAVAAPLGIPLMILLSLPTISYLNGTTIYYYIAFFGILGYLLLLMLVLYLRRKKSDRLDS